MVTVHLDDDLVSIMRLAEEPIDRLTRESIVLELYRRGTISSGRAALALGMERIAFIKYASSRGIPYIDMTSEEWEAEKKAISSWRRD